MTVLGIESSCDETAVAVVRDGDEVLSSVVYSQVPLHQPYGGVVPEVASRAHVQKIRAVAEEALAQAFPNDPDPWAKVDAIAATRGPGLAAALLVGWTFAKGLALALGKPLIPVNHMHAHLWSVRLGKPELRGADLWPQLGLAVSGGHSAFVDSPTPGTFRLLGQTIDDAAGEAIDKCSKVMGLGYPGGPIIDRLARQGNPHAYKFSEPHIPGLDYSFSGLKTSFLYSLREWIKDDPDFIEHHKEDLAASLEFTIVDILMKKLRLAVKQTGIKHVAVAGGVSANNGLRNAFNEHAQKYGWTIYIPKFSYTTDNAAMIGITGYYKYLDKVFCSIDKPAFSKVTFK